MKRKRKGQNEKIEKNEIKKWKGKVAEQRKKTITRNRNKNR